MKPLDEFGNLLKRFLVLLWGSAVVIVIFGVMAHRHESRSDMVAMVGQDALPADYWRVKWVSADRVMVLQKVLDPSLLQGLAIVDSLERELRK